MIKKKRSRATLKALKKEGHSAASPTALSRHATRVAKERGPAKRHQSAVKAVRTKGQTLHSRGKAA